MESTKKAYIRWKKDKKAREMKKKIFCNKCGKEFITTTLYYRSCEKCRRENATLGQIYKMCEIEQKGLCNPD